MLSKLCHENSFYFTDNSSINQNYLFKNGLHLRENGKIILARNFAYYVIDGINCELN